MNKFGGILVCFCWLTYGEFVLSYFINNFLTTGKKGGHSSEEPPRWKNNTMVVTVVKDYKHSQLLYTYIYI